MNIYIILLFVVCCCCVHSSRLFADPIVLLERRANEIERTQQDISETPTYAWKTDYFDATIDNFAFTSNQTYRMKYLYNLTYYQSDGPIFFYTGNEGSIEGFAKNTGIMYDLAKKFNAAIVFAEHRYYGTSLPYGNLSYTNVKYLGYLASTQALADYAKLIPYLKANVIKRPPDTPVIAFGGSYGGMLTAWFRMKYPHIITGAWASSAPLLYFPGGNVNPGGFEKVSKQDFLDAGCNEKTIMNGISALQSLPNTVDGLKFLNNLFHVDPKSKLTSASDGGYLVSWVQEAMDYMAMVDYPYPSNFLKDLPGWPINFVCEHFAKEEVTDPKEAATVLYQISNVYYNFSGDQKTNCVNYNICGDSAIASLGSALGWPWQTCTELVLDMCSEGPPNDFFSNDCKKYGGAINMQYESCPWFFSKMGWYKGFLHPNAVAIEYGFNFAAASNIVFTNGGVDPWSAGGVYAKSPGIEEAEKNGVYTFLIAGSAHHLDLRQPNTCDPPPLTNARYQIVNIISCWIKPDSCKTMPEATPLPPFKQMPGPCNYIINGYPWGQKGYESTTQGYGSTTQGYGSTTQGYGSTTQGYGSTTQGFGSTTQGYGGTTHKPVAITSYDHNLKPTITILLLPIIMLMAFSH